VNLPSRLVSVAGEYVDAARLRAAVDVECATMVAAIRKRCPDAFPPGPLGAGEVGAIVDLTTDEATKVFSVAFADALQANGSSPVVWSAGDDELLVFTADARLVTADGFAVVAVHVYSEQTGDAQITVPFALGSATAPLGLVMGTESVPRGPALIVQRWGEHLQGAAWQALLHLASGVAAAAGVDDQNQPLLPAALIVSVTGVGVLPQARHTFDRAAFDRAGS
jgi:hypothetical protein